jgi:2-dehydro-3-deoxyphosphogluconate aldolase/(4S)-4-hydroxy-2-oxoglutarate aldolase
MTRGWARRRAQSNAEPREPMRAAARSRDGERAFSALFAMLQTGAGAALTPAFHLRACAPSGTLAPLFLPPNFIEGLPMARFTRMQVLNAIYDISVVPVFYHPDLETAKNVVAAVSRGGCKLVEFVNRGDHAWEVFSELERHFGKADPSLILGVGSIVDPYTAAMYINCGANFVVGPSLNAEVAKLCNRRMIPYSPGCGSASEISDAQELGCEIVKVFPGKEVGGPGFVKNVLGPMPWTKIMPTGGVESSEESLTAWLSAGVAAMGMGSNLITKEMLAAKNWAGIEQNVKDTLARVKAIKAKLRG